MYKRQMILQRITCFLLLAAAALVFIYSLGIMTDLYDSLAEVSSAEEFEFKYVEGSKIYQDMQPFNKDLTTAGIILILSAVGLFLFQTHNRRKYYVANYISIGINTVLNVGVSIWALTNVFQYKAQYLLVDFEKLREVCEFYPIKYIQSTFWFDISLAVFIPLLLFTLVNIGSMIWKIMLMKAEKKLIEEGKEG